MDRVCPWPLRIGSDLHATLLNQLKIAGRDFSLTDVFGEAVRDILV